MRDDFILFLFFPPRYNPVQKKSKPALAGNKNKTIKTMVHYLFRRQATEKFKDSYVDL